MGGDDGSGNRQTQAGSLGGASAAVEATKGFEEVANARRRDPRAVVFEGEDGRAVALAGGDRDGAAADVVADGVFDQVSHERGDEDGVGPRDGRVERS